VDELRSLAGQFSRAGVQVAFPRHPGRLGPGGGRAQALSGRLAGGQERFPVGAPDQAGAPLETEPWGRRDRAAPK